MSFWTRLGKRQSVAMLMALFAVKMGGTILDRVKSSADLYLRDKEPNEIENTKSTSHPVNLLPATTHDK